MTAHVFVDESKSRGFLLAAAIVSAAELARLRQAVDSLRLPGQRRIHFTSERDARRRAIVTALAAERVEVLVYAGPPECPVTRARDLTMARLADDAIRLGAARIVVERDDQAVHSDRRIIRERAELAGRHDILRYEHLRAHEECLLAVPDAVAWCWAKGGDWRRRVAPLVARAVQL